VQGQVGRQDHHRHSPQLGQALHHAGARRHGAGAGLQALRPGRTNTALPPVSSPRISPG
jgi:hypothetical protein